MSNNNTLSGAQEPLPRELWGHLSDLHPDSYEFRQDLEVLNALATETGHAALSHEHIFPPQEIVPPPGFSREVIVEQGCDIDLGQFDGRIFSFQHDEQEVHPDVRILTTDAGATVALCDLRGYMSSRVRKGGPASADQQAAVDWALIRDLKFYAENGHSKKRVTDVAGINYSAVGGTKIRTYWAPVSPKEPLGVPLVGRLADCGNSVAGQGDLYVRLFRRQI
jgi:hypothetical protein